MSQVIDALEWRYAVKKFDATKMLSHAQIDTLKKAFNLTATSFGLQPVQLLIIENKEVQEELVAHSMKQRQVADCSHLLVFCIENRVDDAYVNSYFNRVKEVRQTPQEILEPFQNYLIDVFDRGTDTENALWATKQAYLTMGNLLTVCAIEKIDACPMEGFDPKGYDSTLRLAERGLSAVLVMPIGYRAEDDMFASLKKVRKEIGNIVIEM